MALYQIQNPAIELEKLRQIAETRILEAYDLLERKWYSGAMFLAGCAVECYLKVAICVTLKLDGLPSAFKIHDLEALALFSGFRSDLEAQKAVEVSFVDVVKEWKPDGRQSLLYGAPSTFTEEKAIGFFKCVMDPNIGVIPWLKNQLSTRQEKL